MRKMKKILIIALLLVLSITIIASGSYASVLDKFDGNTGGVGDNKVRAVVSAVLEVVRIVGAGLAVVMILILGIKYTIASASDRADIKKSATVYVLGAIIMFGASGILGIIQNIITTSLGDS